MKMKAFHRAVETLSKNCKGDEELIDVMFDEFGVHFVFESKGMRHEIIHEVDQVTNTKLEDFHDCECCRCK